MNNHGPMLIYMTIQIALLVLVLSGFHSHYNRFLLC